MELNMIQMNFFLNLYPKIKFYFLYLHFAFSKFAIDLPTTQTPQHLQKLKTQPQTQYTTNTQLICLF